MKKTITLMTLLAGAVGAYSQGIVNFADYSGQLQQQFFQYNASDATHTAVTYGTYTVMEQVGSSAAANASPQGTTVYNGAPLSGTGYDAQVYAGAGGGDSLASLTAVGTSPLHFQTVGAALGYIKGTSTITLPTPMTGTISLAIAVWNNGAGAYTTLAAAQAANAANTAVGQWGFSSVGSMSVNNLSPTPIPANSGIEGASLGVATPEPSTIALGVMGASALLFRRRK